MRNIIILLLLIVGGNYMMAQGLARNKQYVLLCDKSEKEMCMYIIDSKYCFISSKNQGFMDLFNPLDIKRVAVIPPSKKESFNEKLKLYCKDYAGCIKGIFCITMKDGKALPKDLYKYYKK